MAHIQPCRASSSANGNSAAIAAGVTRFGASLDFLGIHLDAAHPMATEIRSTILAGLLARIHSLGMSSGGRLLVRNGRTNAVELIALEEAFWYDKLSTHGTPDAHLPVKPEVIAGWRRKLADFTEYRLPEMDKHGIDIQVLSLTSPGIQMQLDTQTAVADARAANNFLATIISDHPGRFQGLAAVPLQDPHQAAQAWSMEPGAGTTGRAGTRCG
jgi:hypothetical protein